MIVSQRDNRWGGIKLGTSSTTIASHGCAITSLGYTVGKYPDYVNERMKSVGGFSNGNLVIWSKVKEAIGVEAYRYTTYDNAKVLEAINLYGCCLVEVDARVIGGTGKHWAVFVGGGKAQDPWFGQEKPTSIYTCTGYAIIKADKAGVGKYMTSSEMIIKKTDFERLVTKSSHLDEVLAKYQVADVEGLYRYIGGINSRSTDLTNQLGTAQAEVKNKEEIIGRIQSQVLILEDDKNQLESRLDTCQNEITQLGKDKGNLAIEVEQLKIQVATLRQQLTEAGVTLSIRDIFMLLWNHKVTIKKG
jgi:archaellum component FlaC